MIEILFCLILISTCLYLHSLIKQLDLLLISLLNTIHSLKEIEFHYRNYPPEKLSKPEISD